MQANQNPEAIINSFKTPDISRAKQARLALEALRDEIGSTPWIEKAIISCDALDWGANLDDKGRPIGGGGKPMSWKSMGIKGE